MSSQYITYQNKLIRVVQEKAASSSTKEKEINIIVQPINIKKNDLSQPQPHLNYSKTINKKGYFEIVGFEKGLDHSIKSNSIQFISGMLDTGRVEKFIKLSAVSLVYDIIQSQYNIYMLVQINSSNDSKLEFIFGYYILDSNSGASSTGNNCLKVINRFQLESSSSSTYNHRILDGPNIISYGLSNNGNSTLYIQSLDLDSIYGSGSNSNGSLNEYKWISNEYRLIKDSTPILYYSIAEAYSSSNSNFENMVPIVIIYNTKLTSIFEKLVLNKENIINQNDKSNLLNKSLVLNHLSTNKPLFKPNEIQIIKTSTSNYFAILLDDTVVVYKEDDDTLPVWELKLKKKASNIYFVNLPLIIDPFEESSSVQDEVDSGDSGIDEKFIWSQGSLVVNFQKEDELVQVYSIATKSLLNEINKVQEIWIHDFLSYGFDQLLIRHIPPAQKAITLSLVPLQYVLNFNRINLNNIIDPINNNSSINNNNNNNKNSKNNEKKSVSFSTIMESLENMSKLAKSEYTILEQQLKSKESLLNYSLQILESIGIPNSNYNQSQQHQQQLNDWGFKLVSIFNRNDNNNSSSILKDRDGMDGMDGSISNTSLKPSLLSKVIYIKDGLLYCQLEFNRPVKSFTLVSVFLSSKEISLFTKLKYTISNSSSGFGIIVSNSNPSTTIMVESSLKDLNLDYYSLNLVNIIVEWSFNSMDSNSNNNNLSYSNNNNSSSGIFSTYLDSFNLNDYLKINNNNNNNSNNNNSRELDNYPYSLDFDIVGSDLSKLVSSLEDIFPKNQFKIQNSLDTDIELYDIDTDIDNNSNNSSNIIIISNNNSNNNNISSIEFRFNKKSRKLITFKINSICFFNLINNLKLLIDNLPNGVNLYLSNQNEWNSKLKLDICNQLKQAFEIVIHEENLSNSLTLNKKEQKNAFIKFHNLYQKVFQYLIETQSLLYNLEVLNKFTQ